MKVLLISPNNVYASARLTEEAKAQGIEMINFSAKEFVENNLNLKTADFDALYVRFSYPYFKEIVSLAQKFKALGKVVVDAVIVDGKVDINKLEDSLELLQQGILVPKTFQFESSKSLIFPCVLKTKYGFGKKEVFLVSNSNELEKIISKFEPKDLIAQEFIKAEYEYKVITAGYKSVDKVLRFKSQASGFGINPVVFEVLDKEQCPEAVALAEKASASLKRELAKTDIIESNSKFYVVEVNRSPGLASFERFSESNVAGEFIKYLKSKAVSST